MTDKRQVYEELLRRKIRDDFWTYCRVTSSDFYTNSRPFLKDLANTMQWFIEESDSEIMVLNMPPRFGKSRTATKLVEWIFGKYGSGTKVMTGSYNETLSETFAKMVRDTIAAEPIDDTLVYSDIFPDTRIKYGEAAVKKWALEGSSQANYLATSPGGTSTGFGCNIMIIDDLIKNVKEAYNESVLQSHIEWFNNTMLQRVEHGYKIIIIMTRWATNDLAGYVLANYDNVVHVNYKAINEDGSMLCEEILSRSDFETKTRNMNRDIVAANYQQEPIDIKGKLYSHFKTYKDVPRDDSGKPLFSYVLNYTDTADTGSDSLCSICYGMYGSDYYILDVYYSKESMEITEPATARMLTRNNVGCAIIESNNGGRGFARNVERICKESLDNYHTTFNWFHQHQNKAARILSNSTAVMNNVYFPINWEDKWPEFSHDLLTYQREGNNAHDDAPDCLTGVYENSKPRGTVEYIKLNGGL